METPPRPPPRADRRLKDKTRAPQPRAQHTQARGRQSRRFDEDEDRACRTEPATETTETEHSPAAVLLSALLLGTAGIRQDPEHVGEGAAIGGLGDEHPLAAEEEEERDTDADGRNGVARHEAQVLLDVADAPERDDRAQVDAPVEPVKEPSRGFRPSVFNLKAAGREDKTA